MSSYSHATIYAQQVGLNTASAPNEVPLNFVYLKTLLDCQYHLITSHLVTPSMRYYERLHADEGDVSRLKQKMKALLVESRQGLLKRPREVIRNYRATWELVE